MLPAFKECVEEAFVRGLVKIVFATETLALGINMPARSVVLEKLVKYNGEAHVDITPGEYTQLTGRAGRRGIDVEGHAVVLWQRNFDPRFVAGLASRRTYPLRSSFSPTYNMAVNMVGRVGREKARGLLEQSFAQFQSDKSVVGLARAAARNTEKIAQLWADAACDRGDFVGYARLRAEISRLEAEAAKSRKADRRAESISGLLELTPGDIIGVPSGRHEGWAVVIDPGVGRDRANPSPLVMTEQRQIKKLSLTDFPSPPVVAGRMRVPKHFDGASPKDRRNLAAAFHTKLRGLDTRQSRYQPAAMDAEIADEVARLRDALRAHPCHGCPDREAHARAAEKALRLEKDTEGLRAQTERRTNTIATRFDKVCAVLSALGYLSEDGAKVTEAGRMLARIYSELDLVTAEAIRAGVFDELDAAELAAVLPSPDLRVARRGGQPGLPGCRIARPRSPRRWCAASGARCRLLERDHKLDQGRDPDIGFAEAVHALGQRRPLGDILDETELTAGDFVRWMRMVIDLLGQVADAAGESVVRDNAREAIDRLRRGVVGRRLPRGRLTPPLRREPRCCVPRAPVLCAESPGSVPTGLVATASFAGPARRWLGWPHGRGYSCDPVSRRARRPGREGRQLPQPPRRR